MSMEFKAKEGGFYTQSEYGELHVSGNAHYGFRPYQLLVASVAVCSGGVFSKILQKQRMKLDDMTIQTDVERSGRGANEITKIFIHFLIKGQELNDTKIEKALQLSSKNCSMVQSVKDSIEVIKTFEIIH